MRTEHGILLMDKQIKIAQKCYWPNCHGNESKMPNKTV